MIRLYGAYLIVGSVIDHRVALIHTCKHAYTTVSQLALPGRTLTSCGHVTHQLTFLSGVEAIDPYITTQVSGTHTMACHMDDESKNPHVST